jgi:hypothetical protein
MQLEYMMDFAVFGLVTNILSFIPLIIMLMYRAAGLTPDEVQEYVHFHKVMMPFIENSSRSKRFARLALALIPTYCVYVNAVAIYYLLRYSGLNGLIKSAISKETFSFVPLVTFHVVYKDINS